MMLMLFIHFDFILWPGDLAIRPWTLKINSQEACVDEIWWRYVAELVKKLDYFI